MHAATPIERDRDEVRRLVEIVIRIDVVAQLASADGVIEGVAEREGEPIEGGGDVPLAPGPERRRSTPVLHTPRPRPSAHSWLAAA